MDDPSKRHKALMELFEEVCDLEPGPRAARLDVLCVNELAGLRDEVERLLGRDDVTLEVLDAPEPFGETWGELVGGTPEQVGPFRILGQLGGGGMGLVFEAEQSEPRRRVALKLLRRGYVSPGVARRFEHEGELLARLSHPAVAQVYAAGMENGERYIAMERVDGVPLDTFVSGRTLEDILRLLATVADGVHHAHQNGVLHRDLKPANILVEADGTPKILDFGVGRVLDPEEDERSMMTVTGEMIGTLSYMSPEQVQGNAREVDTRCDVYALGVLLYRSLAGQPPLDLTSKSIFGAIQEIVESEPKPLRQIAQDVPADVAAIAHKAMAKEKERRYASAAALAEDLRRFLRGEVVSARAATTWYVLSRFTRRHKPLVAAASIALISLVGGLTASTVGFARASAARDRARQEALSKGEVSDFMTGVFRVSDPSEARGNSVTARELLDRAALRLETELLDQPETREHLLRTIADVYQGLGLFAESLPLAEEAYARRSERIGAQDDHLLLDSRRLRAGAWLGIGRASEASGEFEDLVDLLEGTLGEDHPRALSTREDLAAAYYELGRYDEALTIQEDSLATHRRVFGAEHERTLQSMKVVAGAYLTAARFEEAEQLYLELLERARGAHGQDHPEAIAAQSALSAMLRKVGRFEEAEAHVLDALDLGVAIYGENHPLALDTLGELGNLRYDQRRFGEALQVYEQTRERRFAQVGPDHPRTLEAVSRIAASMVPLGRQTEALPLLKDNIERRRRLFPPDHPNTINDLGNLAAVYQSMGRLDDAEPLTVEVLEARLAIFGEEHPATANTLRNLGLLHEGQGRLEESAGELERAWQIYRDTLGEEHPQTQLTTGDLDRVLQRWEAQSR